MKHLKTINEYHRTVGFRYSEPKESYNVSLLCKGQEIDEEKINLGLSKVSTLKYNPESIEVNVLEPGTIANLGDVQIEIDAIVSFDVTIYNQNEVNGIVSELGQKLSQFDIEILDFKSKEKFEL